MNNFAFNFISNFILVYFNFLSKVIQIKGYKNPEMKIKANKKMRIFF